MKFSRTFSANPGDYSTGTAGPDQIEYDLDQIAKNLDPTQDGGGIGAENMADSTIDQTITDTYSNTGTITQLLSWIVKTILEMKGTVTNWYDAGAATIETLWGKFNASTGHSHTGNADDAPQIGTAGIADSAVTDAKIGDRTVDPILVGGNNTGTLTQILSWFAKLIKAITGKTNWYDLPVKSIEQINDEMAGLALGQIPDGTITDAKLSSAPTDIKQVVAEHKADLVTHVIADERTAWNAKANIATGQWIDTTTTPAAGTYTKTIPIGFTGKRGRLIAKYSGANSLAAIVFFDTVNTHAQSLYIEDSTHGGKIRSVDADLGINLASTSPLVDVYISGTNLIIKLNSSGAQLKTQVYWEVEG